MNVYELSVRFMRRAQVKEYEPMEAEVMLKANLAEGEDHNAAAVTLMRDARNAAIEAGLKSGATKAETTATAASSDKPQGRPKKEELTPAAPKADKPAAEKPAAAKPAAKPAAEKPAPAPAAETETNEFGEPIGGEEAAADEPEITGKELQAWITDLITNKKIAVTQAKEVLAKYKAAGSLQVKDGDRRKVVADIKALIDG